MRMLLLLLLTWCPLLTAGSTRSSMWVVKYLGLANTSIGQDCSIAYVCTCSIAAVVKPDMLARRPCWLAGSAPDSLAHHLKKRTTIV